MHTVIQYSKEASRNIHINSLIRSLKGKYRAEMNVTHEAPGFDMRQLMYYERSPTGRSQLVHSFWHSRRNHYKGCIMVLLDGSYFTCGGI
jgi:hypothetical protein